MSFVDWMRFQEEQIKEAFLEKFDREYSDFRYDRYEFYVAGEKEDDY